MASDDCQVMALADLGCGQDPEIAGAFILRLDRIDKSLESPQRVTIDRDKAVVVERGLYREGRLIDDGKPSSTRRVEPFVEGDAGGWHLRRPVCLLGQSKEIQPHGPVLPDRDQVLDCRSADSEQRCRRILTGKIQLRKF
jgi:hypothetical protein